MSKKLISVLLVLLLLTLSAFGAGAANSISYTYTAKGETARVPAPYETTQVLAHELGLSEPQDMAVSGEYLYILDSGNYRVVVLSTADYSFVREIKIDQSGFSTEAAPALTGLCIDGDTMLVVDNGSEKIYRTDMNGKLLQEYVSPYDKDSGERFQPKHVAVDRTGYLYILLETEHRGLMIMDPSGDFRNYFGSVNVTVTATVLTNMFWRNFLTEEQIATGAQNVPGGYENVTTDGKGFIYTVRGASDTTNELVCKLNPSGKNVLGYTKRFGDIGTKTTTSFAALAVDDNGMISVLDKANKHIFQYSPDGELLYIFGSKAFQEGTNNMPQNGTFITPVDVEYNGKELLVLDRDAASITVMRPTRFGQLVQEATLLHRKAEFDEAGKMWQEVLTLNSNYEKAYVGLGKVAEASGDFAEAMEYYELGSDKDYYSSAFKKYRTEMLRESFYWIVLAAVVLIAGVVVLMKFWRKKHPEKKSLEYGGKLAYMFYILRHPIDGFSELRYNQKFSVKYASIIAALYFFISCLNYNYNGYIFNSDSAEDFNMWIVLCSTVAVVALFCLSTWLLTTFLEGKGRFSEIWVVSCYSLIPMVVVSALSLVLSNVMTSDESFFYYALQTIATGWTLIMIFISNGRLNQYGFKKNIVSLLLAIVGMLIILFLLFLFVNLWTQLFSFFGSLYDEITYRNLAAS